MPFYRNSCLLAGIAASIVAASALQAQEKPSYQIYGTLVTFVDNIQATGASTSAASSNALVTVSATAANVPARTRITCGTSNIGFKGDYQTPVDGLKIFWQVESSVSVDGDQPSTLAGRNSALGLVDPTWGRVFVGSWDTPYKFPTLFMGAMRSLLPFDGNLYGNPGFNIPGTVTNSGRVGSKNDASFSRRQGNSIQYWSPEFAGFSTRLAYSVNEGRTTTDSAAQPQLSPTVLSALVTYKHANLTLNAGYERHNDYFGLNQLTSSSSTAGSAANPTSKDEGLELVGIYLIPSTGTRITGLVEQLKYHNDREGHRRLRPGIQAHRLDRLGPARLRRQQGVDHRRRRRQGFGQGGGHRQLQHRRARRHPAEPWLQPRPGQVRRPVRLLLHRAQRRRRDLRPVPGARRHQPRRRHQGLRRGPALHLLRFRRHGGYKDEAETNR